MHSRDKQIIALALPALGALAAEPVFLLADTAMVGHLGPEALAALALAGALLQTVLGLMVFLAYATTPRVARFLGSGDRPGAIGAGIDGMWLAAATSVILVAAGLPLLDTALGWFNPTAEVAALAREYLTISWWGLPFMLIVIAGTGLLRGLQNTKVPLAIAAGGFAVNIALNALFIYGLDLGVAGSALGTVCAQGLMCLTYAWIAVLAARHYGARLRPDFHGVFHAARMSGWLLLRNASLRAAILVLVALAAAQGTVQLAAVQVAQTLFNSLAMVLDSLAIAGQALIGLELGRRRRAEVHAVHRRLIGWGVGFGTITGVVMACLSPWLPALFTSDEHVRPALTILILVLAASLPLGGYVFTLDGVLMGAEDSRYLALAQLGAFLGFALLCWLGHLAGWGTWGLWACFCWGFLAFRGIGLGLRMRGDAWIERAEARG
ncbi:MATE family efflux transporter [Brevibacterium sp. 91QC2O2]|uniref:MATE family efflux transporter n=1 Tax=Brevibacterium sp. 91QC2O2 TaxID=2968458 RepID=UPI00211C34B8|nr:MATE family efflux transporter [Brevibacterium sp. 91QC2O2]